MATAFPTVVHLVISLAPGGLERLVVDWTNARNRRYSGSTWICCLDERGALAGQVEGGGVVCMEAKRSRFPWDRITVRRVTDWLSAPSSPPHAPRILHAHNLAAWQYGVLVKVRHGWRRSLRLIYTQHGANVHNMAWANRLRSRLLACFTDEMVAVSGATAEVMAKAMWLPGKRIRVIANGIDAGRHSEFRIQNPDSRRSQESEGNSPETGQPNNQKLLEGSPIRVKLGISEDTLVMGSVGRLAHVKGYDRLIGVFAALAPESKVSPCLLLIGDGPERASLERQAQDLGVADRVIFAGYQADPGPYLMAMDVFVLPSRSEGLSVSLLEAMAAGVPVAVTDVGANREVIEGGRCGTLLPGDDRMWAGVFEDVSANSDSVQAKADLARHRVREHYSIEATLEGYERLYARSPVL